MDGATDPADDTDGASDDDAAAADDDDALSLVAAITAFWGGMPLHDFLPMHFGQQCLQRLPPK